MTDQSAAPTQTAVVTSPHRASFKDLVAVLALLLTVITLLVGGGKVLGSIEDNALRFTSFSYVQPA